jgi:hypothetical protein
MILVSVTRLHLKSNRYLPDFVWHTATTAWQIINIQGFVGGRLIQDDHGGYWTVTMWENKQAMLDYRNSGAHRRVMPLLQKWCDEAVLVHWEQPDRSLPSMEEAYLHILENGYFARLTNPSTSHLEKKVSQPRFATITGQALPLKPRKKSSVVNVLKQT